MFRPANSPPHLITLVLLTAISVLTLNMYIPSLAAMGKELDVSYAEISLSLSLYMALTAVLQIIMGPIADRFGRRPVIVWSLIAFLVASIGCALAPDYLTFMAFRLLQGTAVSAAALARAIVRDTSPPNEAAVRLGKIGMAMALAPMIAPMIGGILESFFGWRSNFWAFTGMALALLWLSWTDVGETNPSKSTSIMEQLRKYPVVALSKAFWSYTFCLSFCAGVFFSYITGVPLIGFEHFGMSPGAIGAVMGIPPIGFLIGNWVTTRIGSSVALSSMMIWGRIVNLALLAIGLGVLLVGATHPAAFFVWMIAIGIGNGLSMPAANAGAMSVRPDMAGTAAGLSGAFAIFMGAVASAITGATLTISNHPETFFGILIAFGIAGLFAALPARAAERLRDTEAAQDPRSAESPEN